MAALRLGLAVNDEYEAGLELDSTLYDLYAGLGSYHYWKSAKAGMLRWVGIFKNEKDKGVRELQLAVDSSLIHRDLARSALIWIRIDQKQYDSAAALAAAMSEIHPGGTAFLWPLAQARFKAGRYSEALGVYRRLRERYADEPENYYNLVECDYYVVQCLNWLSETSEARDSATRVYTYYDLIPDKTLRRQSAKLSYLKRVAARR
jgi:hypothetical protein